jgi:hypothetical protein
MSGKHTNIRARAADYAKIFLAQKYKEEYQELYRAYLTNRGINVREQGNVIDERLLVNNIKAGN